MIVFSYDLLLAVFVSSMLFFVTIYLIFSRPKNLNNKEDLEKISFLVNNINSVIHDFRSQNSEILSKVEKVNSILSGSMIKEIGIWGEIKLKNILEQSGFVENVDFFCHSYPAHIGNTTLKPDFVINIGQNSMIIDCKSPLKNYSLYMDAIRQNLDYKPYLINHVKSIKAHIKYLYDKGYDRVIDKQCVVVMFMPIEDIATSAISADPMIINYALKYNISLSTPTSIGLTIATIKKYVGILNFEQHSAMQYKKIENIYSDIAKVFKSAETSSNVIKNKLTAFDKDIKNIEHILLELKNIIDGNVSL